MKHRRPRPRLRPAIELVPRSHEFVPATRPLPGHEPAAAEAETFVRLVVTTRQPTVAITGGSRIRPRRRRNRPG